MSNRDIIDLMISKSIDDGSALDINKINDLIAQDTGLDGSIEIFDNAVLNRTKEPKDYVQDYQADFERLRPSEMMKDPLGTIWRKLFK